MIHLQLFGGGGGGSWGNGKIKEITHPAARAKGHREYRDVKTGYKFRYDPPRGKDPEHWHLENPNSKEGNKDKYLDKNGNPSERHKEESALTKDELEKLLKEYRRKRNENKWTDKKI